MLGFDCVGEAAGQLCLVVDKFVLSKDREEHHLPANLRSGPLQELPQAIVGFIVVALLTIILNDERIESAFTARIAYYDRSNQKVTQSLSLTQK